jgi:hypothetical protein
MGEMKNVYKFHVQNPEWKRLLEETEPIWRCSIKTKNAVFWDVASCRSYVNPRFGGTYRLHLQGKEIRE